VRLTDFHLLLLEDDPALLAGIVRAAQQARLGANLQVVRDRREAIEYLSRLDHTSEAGAGSPQPALFLLNLEGKAGLSVLEWLRHQPRLRRMVKVGLFSAGDGAVTDRAYDLGVNSCLARPDTPTQLAEMFHSIRQYWVALNHPPQL
jgi:two-component system response regulator